MRFSLLAPIGAVSAVAAGVALLGSSLGGIASVDHELAAAAPSATDGLAARSVDSGQAGLRPVRSETAAFGDRSQTCARTVDGPARSPQLRILSLIDDQGARRIVVVVAPRAADGCGAQHHDARPPV